MRTLQNNNIAKVGDYIRAYDFKPMKGREDIFVEGDVEAITNEPGYRAYKITVRKDICDGKDLGAGPFSRVNKIVFVPFQVSFMEFAGRIMNLSE